MGTINVTSKRTGNTYPIAIAGSRPTEQEDAFIQQYVDRQDGVLAIAPEEDDDSQGGLIDFAKSTAGGVARSFTEIPGGLAALGETILGEDVGTTSIGKAAQSFSNNASEYIQDTFDMNESVASKSGQAFGSMLSFLIPSTAVAKGVSLLGATSKGASFSALGTAAIQGSALQSQDQMNRMANFIENGGEIDEETKRNAIALSGAIGLSEAAPISYMFRSLGTAMKILKKVPKNKVDDALRTISGKLKRSLVAGTFEGGQELAAGLLQDLVEKNLYNPDLKVGQSAYDDAVYGGGAGAALNLIIDSIRGRQLKKLDTKYQQLDQDQNDETSEANEKLRNAANFIKSKQTLQLPAPEGTIVDETFDKDQKLSDFGDVANDQSTQNFVDNEKKLQNEIKKQEEINQTLEASKELKSPFLPVELGKLPQEEAYKIRKARVDFGKNIEVDAPATLQEIEEVVGIESANRERATQKPILTGQQQKKDYFPEIEDVDAKSVANKFTETILKAKVINRAEVKRIAARINKLFPNFSLTGTKMSNEEADNVLNNLLAKGALQYTPPVVKNGKIIKAGKYTSRVVEKESGADMESQAAGLTELAKRNIEAQKTLEEAQEQYKDDAIQLETNRQQLEILRKEYSDIQRMAFDLENKATRLDEKQDKIKATNIVPNYVAKKAFDNSAELQLKEEYKLKQKQVLRALRRELTRIGLADVRFGSKDLIDETELERSINAAEADIGITEGTFEATKDGQKIIALAMEIYDPSMSNLELQKKLSGVMNHEVIHALKNLGLFTNEEYLALEKAVAKRKYVKVVKGKKQVREYTYLDRATRMYSSQGLTQDQIAEEAIAEMYRDYASGKLNLGGKPKSLFDKIISFIKGIFTVHNNEGFKDIDAIFDNIQTTDQEKQIGRRAREDRPDRDYLDVNQREDVRNSRIYIPKVLGDTEYYEAMPKNVKLKTFKNRSMPNGTLVGIRPNLNGFITLANGKKQVTQSIHNVNTKDRTKYSEAVGYDHTVALANDVKFDIKQSSRADIYNGKVAKHPMASGVGEIQQLTREEIQEIVDSPDHIIGFNPGFMGNENRAQVNGTHLFTDSDGYAVKGYNGGRVVFIGNQVYGKGGEVDYWLESEAPKVEGGAPSDVIYKYSMDKLPSLFSSSLGPLDRVQKAKADYLASKNIAPRRQDKYVSVDVDLAKRIANDFDMAVHDPFNPDVQDAYKAMNDETFEQWQFVKATGVKIEMIKKGQSEPYPNGSKDMLSDLHNNNHMWVYPTDSGFGTEPFTQEDIDNNPLLAKTGEIVDGQDLRYNDLFRIVHDYFGHGLEGATFSSRGEENAWQAHVRMYSPLAAKAMTTETRGQNSWVNYSDAVGEQNRNSKNKAEETQYAEQKVTILSDFVMEDGLANDMEGEINEQVKRRSQQFSRVRDDSSDRGRYERRGGGQADVLSKSKPLQERSEPEVTQEGTVTLTHFSPIEGLQSVDPEKQRSNLFMRGEERRRTYPGYPARSYYAINITDPDGYNPEPNVGENIYEIQVPYNDMYDWAKDKNGYNALANAEATKEMPNLSGANRVAYITTAMERMIKESGASGYWAKSAGRGFTAAMFNELKIAETYQPQKYNQAYKDKINQKRGDDATRLMRSAVVARGQEHTISTRFPTAQSRKDDPLQSLLFVNGDAIRNDKELARKAANLIKGYNISQNSKLYANFSDLEIIEDYIEAAKDNLLFIHDSIDPETRDRSSRWYDGARAIVDRFSQEYGYRPEVIAAVMAAQSPQKDWYMNVSLSERVLDITKNFGNIQFTPEMMQTARKLFGKDKYKAALNHISNPRRNSNSLNSLELPMHKAMWIRIFDETYNDRGHRIVTPEGDFLDYARTKNGQPKKTGWGSLSEISKAIDVMDDPSLENISIIMGKRHKIRSFYNNIITPMSTEGHSTIDTHAVAAAHLKPLSGKSLEVDHNFGLYTKKGRAEKFGIIPNSSVSGSYGTYGLLAEAYEKAANERGILPRQMQSITWEAIRGLYKDTFKANEQKVAQIENIWDRYTEGNINIDEARQEVLDATTTGFEAPAWSGQSDTVSAELGDSSYQRELSRSRLSRGDPTDDGRTGGVAPRGTEIRKSAIRASLTGATPREQTAIQNDSYIEESQQTIRYNNLAGIIEKGLKIVPQSIINKFGNSFPMMGKTRRDAANRIVTKFQDSFQPIADMMDTLRDKGYNISDVADTYLQEKNSHGTTGAQLTDLEETIVKPILEEVKKVNITDDQLNNLSALSQAAAQETGQEGFVKTALELGVDNNLVLTDILLYARHAKERNKKIIQDHKRPLGSGMSNAEATAILQWFDGLNAENKTIFNNIVDLTKNLIESTNAKRLESGLITQETYDKRVEYKNYVPLRGDMDAVDEATDDRLNRQRKTVNLFGAMGNEDRSAKGRGTKYAENILASAIAQNQRAIDRGERNKVGVSFLKLIRGENESQDGTVATNDQLASDMSKNIAYIATKDPMNPNQFAVKENGQEVYVNIYSGSIARSLKLHAEPQTNNGFIRGLAKLNKWLSNVNTTYNPAFVIPNLAKDLETALVNAQQYDLEGITKEIGLSTGKAILGIRNVLRTENTDSFWSQEYLKFVKAGGKNATNMMSSVQDQMENMGKLLNDIGGTQNQGLHKVGFRKLLKFLDDYNTAVENGVRVATFTALKKRGFSDARAAEAARDVTVNFAKGGEDKVAMNSLYLFYNASLQGSMALLMAARRSPRVRKIWLGMIAYGLLQDQMMAMLSDDEDDNGIKQYDDLDDYTLEHNLVFPSMGLSDKKFVKIPLAYGLNMAVNLGRSLSRYTRGEYTFGQASSSIFNTTMETLSPFGAIENWQTYALPTFLDPLAELGLNVNYRGDPIYKESPMYASSPRPDSQQYWGNTGTIPKFIVDQLNSLTGGDEVESGIVDWSPDVIEYWIEFITGGAGATVNRFGNLAFGVIPDVITGDFDGNIESRIPFLRKVIAQPSERVDTQTYLENRKGLFTIFARLDLANRRGDVEDIRRLRARYGDELRILGRFKAIDNARNRMLRQIRELERNLRIPDETRKKLIRLRTEKIQELMRKGVVLMREVGLKER